MGSRVPAFVHGGEELEFLLPIITALILLVPAWAADKPNIVIFLADDLGYGSVGYQGGKPKTPTLDTLARDAVGFTDLYSGVLNGSPSRACLLTGRSATRVGMYNGRPGRSPMVLRASEVTIAELLRDAGYRTGVFGKWHLGEALPHGGVVTPVDHAFEYSFVTDLNAGPGHRNPNSFIRNGVKVGRLTATHVNSSWTKRSGNSTPTGRASHFFTTSRFTSRMCRLPRHPNWRPAILARPRRRRRTAPTWKTLSAPSMMERVRGRTFDTFELYNLWDDPAQKKDLVAQHPEKLAELKQQLLDLLASARAEGPDWRDVAPKP